MKIVSNSTGKNHRTVQSLATIGALFLFPALLSAHPGHGGGAGLAHGLLHPLSGIDHICAMVAVGLWAASRGGRALWAAPLTFVTVMAGGAILGMAGLQIPFVEGGIVASLLVLGMLIAAAVRLPLSAGLLLIGFFALFHGYAHGIEIPENAPGVLFGTGFLLSTILLHVTGLALGLSARRFGRESFFRYAGAAVTAVGFAMLFV